MALNKDHVEIIERLCNPIIRYDVNPNWVKAIILQESAGDPYAMRFEEGYKYLFYPERYKKWNTLSTETMAQKTSWGLGQIMGGLAREQGLQGSLGQLLDPKINIQHMCIRIVDLFRYSKDPKAIFACYNAGPGALGNKKPDGSYPNQYYVDSVYSYLQHFEK